jgi:hypothetical protein
MTNTHELSRIVDQLRRLHEGDAWHGPSLHEALEGVTPEMAAKPVMPSAHSIYGLTHHVAAWANEVTQRVQGRTPQMPDEGDFPAPVESLSDLEWDGAKARVGIAHARLVEAILAFEPARLHDPVGPARDAPLGTVRIMPDKS